MKPSTRDQRHVVYRCYDADDRLVYVGMTSLPLHRRMNVHDVKNPAVTATSVRVECSDYPDRFSASLAESRAIDTEGPLLNIRRGAAYDHGWDELAAAVNSLPSVR